ncbi:MAG: hypothetical protein HY303_15520 [Candidatus Wallbacteria bacterium]|nr:hypothetical protein [Candidatus Wallbacteria bacterium]
MQQQRQRACSRPTGSLDIARVYAPRELGRRKGRLRRFAGRLARLFRRSQGVESGTDSRAQELPDRLGPKRRALREQHGRDSLKRGIGYLAGLFIVGFSLWQASHILAEHGSEGSMVNVLLGIFSGIVVLFLLTHDTAVARRQRAREHIDGA